MKKLRSNQRPDNLLAREAWQSGRWSRRIYLLILASIGLIVLNYTVGDAIILRADGMVVRNRYAVAATFPAKVSQVYVTEGDTITAGQVLAKLESADILKDIAQLSVQYADISARDAQIKIRAATNQDLLPLAEQHARQTAQAVQQYKSMKGLIPTGRQDQALGSEYTTAARLAELKNEAAVIEKQLPLVDVARQKAEGALTQLDNFYDDGKVRAPAAGVVGTKVPVPGEVVRFGDVLFDVYGDQSQVLAYLPEMYLFPIGPGQKVEISGGRTSAVGVISAVLPVADALPPEFQNTFRPRDRGQLVRIAVPADVKFAVSQKISISGCAFGWCWASEEASAGSTIARLWKSLTS